MSRPEHFIVVAGLPKQPDSEIVMSRAANPRMAHGFAADEFRRKRGLASNVYVQTATAYRCDDEDEAVLFMARFLAQLDEAAANNGAADQPSESPTNGRTAVDDAG